MWHIWTIDDWEKNIDLTREGHRTGLRLRFDKDIDSEVRRACKEFAVFLRREYFFTVFLHDIDFHKSSTNIPTSCSLSFGSCLAKL